MYPFMKQVVETMFAGLGKSPLDEAVDRSFVRPEEKVVLNQRYHRPSGSHPVNQTLYHQHFSSSVSDLDDQD